MGVIGLDYNIIFEVAKVLQIEIRETEFLKIRVLEHTVLEKEQDLLEKEQKLQKNGRNKNNPIR